MGTQHDALAAFIYARRLVPEDQPLAEIAARADLCRAGLAKLVNDLDTVGTDDADEHVQSIFYEAGKLHFGSELRWWFRLLYQILLLEDEGPRLGQFTKIMTPYWVQERVRAAMEDHWVLRERIQR